MPNVEGGRIKWSITMRACDRLVNASKCRVMATSFVSCSSDRFDGGKASSSRSTSLAIGIAIVGNRDRLAMVWKSPQPVNHDSSETCEGAETLCRWTEYSIDPYITYPFVAN